MIGPKRLVILISTTLLLLVGCGRSPAPAPGPNIDWSDPNVGGGVGLEIDPGSLAPYASPTIESSPRLDAAARATADARQPAASSPPVASPAPSATLEAVLPIEPADPEPAPPVEEEPPAPEEIVYIVQPGDTLFTIGLQFGLSWVTIAEFNGIVDPDSIDVGQEIRIPVVEVPEP